MPAPVGDWEAVLANYAPPGDPEALVDGAISPDMLQRARAGYYGHMTHIDQQINRFTESLRVYDVGDNTLIMFTADHGEMLGDHTLFRKAYPYEGSACVPFIVAPAMCNQRLPDVVPGSVFEQPVALRDVMPTLLDCANVPIGVQCIAHHPKSRPGLARLCPRRAYRLRPIYALAH